MREYELAVIYDLAVAEAGGAETSVEQLTQLVEARGGKVIKVDHWGRRRMAYPINHAIDGDYIITRVELEPTDVAPLEAALGIDERVYRHIVVRADELPVPPPPREPRPERIEADGDEAAPTADQPEAALATVTDAVVEEPVAEAEEGPAVEENPSEDAVAPVESAVDEETDAAADSAEDETPA